MGLTSPVARASETRSLFGTTRVQIDPPPPEPEPYIDLCVGYGSVYWPKDTPRPNFIRIADDMLFYETGVEDPIICPYRSFIFLRVVALAFFLTWRLRHPNHDAMWLWGISLACELWFSFSWLLDHLVKRYPVVRYSSLRVLKARIQEDSSSPGEFYIAGIDVFVSTPEAYRPPLVIANTILSVLAVDYPVEKVACYLSDDGGALLTFEALAETASFARAWVPFCRKHQIVTRSPEAYFRQTLDFRKDNVRLDFMRDRKTMHKEYEQFKLRINSLPESIRIRSNSYNAKNQMEAATGSGVSQPTWMSDGSHWPGTWASEEPQHSKGDHAGIIKVVLAPPNAEPEFGGIEEADGEKNLIDSTDVDIRLPMLVYVSREKRPGYDHNKKAGAMNALLRTSAVMSNGPFILNLDCDHYIYNSLAIMEGMCFMLDDYEGDRLCYVQFPQRFEGIDPSDRFANHNTVFFEAGMRGFDGLQGPIYVGTDCIFRRTALYGFSPPPPRATKQLSKKKDEVVVLIDPNDDDADIKSRFGNSTSLAASIQDLQGKGTHERLAGSLVDATVSEAMPVISCSDEDKTERGKEDEVVVLIDPNDEDADSKSKFDNSTSLAACIQDLQIEETHERLTSTLVVPHEPLNDATVSEAMHVISCAYEDKTEWGKGVGWIYGSVTVTGDVVTGYKMHDRGWSSVYCLTNIDAFRGTAPINLTDRLHQVFRWATGSVEIFFSKNNALYASPRMKSLQKLAYFNLGMYPFTSLFLIIYCFLPAISLFSGQFIVQSVSATFLVLLLGITITQYWIARSEIMWSGVTLHDWWRNKQFLLIGGTSAHLAAVLQRLLKVVSGVDISKSANPNQDIGDDDEFADLYAAKWSFLMIPPITIMMVHMIAIVVGIYRTLFSPFPQWSKLVGGVFFSFGVLCHLYPFAKGLFGRRGKVSTIVYVWSGLLSIIISMLFGFT